MGTDEEEDDEDEAEEDNITDGWNGDNAVICALYQLFSCC